MLAHMRSQKYDRALSDEAAAAQASVMLRAPLMMIAL